MFMIPNTVSGSGVGGRGMHNGCDFCMSRNPVQKAVMHIYSNARDLAEVALATKIIKMAACIHKEAGRRNLRVRKNG